MPWKVIEEKTENGRIFMLSELVDYSKEEKEEMLKFKMKCEKDKEKKKNKDSLIQCITLFGVARILIVINL